MTPIEGRLSELEEEQRKALLVGVYLAKEKELCEEHLSELENLCDTYGLKTVEKMACPLRKIESSTFLGKGKVEEIAERVKETGADIVVFDEEIAPQQQRNLEKIFEKPVIDRAELILGVFEVHARSKESSLQVELAQCKYQLPRLKRMWTHLSRQRVGGASAGGGGYLKGTGESQIETDRRLVRRRMDKLKKDLVEVGKQREIKRRARKRTGIPTFAIVGYTNAGKSALLNALTEAEVLVEDKLFATLDTTTRKFLLPNKQEVLLIDTVGFIRKLPHDLIESFKSTLEETVQTDILLHIVDASNPQAIEQADATLDVLKELKVHKRPVINVLNKSDECSNKFLINKLRIKYPKTVLISAKEKEGFDQLVDRMMKEVSLLRKVVDLKIPQSEYAVVSEIIRQGKVMTQEYEENNILLKVEIPTIMEHKIEPYIIHETQEPSPGATS